MSRVKKDENVLQTLLRINKKGDKTDALLFDVLSNCDNKTDLIKNALFNYIVNIQNGNIIDRAYPYNQVDKFMDVISLQSSCPPIPQSNTSFSQEEQIEFNTNNLNSSNKAFEGNLSSLDSTFDSQDSKDKEKGHEDEYIEEYEDENEDKNEYEDDNLDLPF